MTSIVSVHARAVEMGIGDLEELSDRNLIRFFAYELRVGDFGSLPRMVVRRLRRLGYVKHTHRRGQPW